MKHCFAVCICLFSSFVMAVAQEGGIVGSASPASPGETKEPGVPGVAAESTTAAEIQLAHEFLQQYGPMQMEMNWNPGAPSIVQLQQRLIVGPVDKGFVVVIASPEENSSKPPKVTSCHVVWVDNTRIRVAVPSTKSIVNLPLFDLGNGGARTGQLADIIALRAIVAVISLRELWQDLSDEEVGRTKRIDLSISEGNRLFKQCYPDQVCPGGYFGAWTGEPRRLAKKLPGESVELSWGLTKWDFSQTVLTRIKVRQLKETEFGPLVTSCKQWLDKLDAMKCTVARPCLKILLEHLKIKQGAAADNMLHAVQKSTESHSSDSIAEDGDRSDDSGIFSFVHNGVRCYVAVGDVPVALTKHDEVPAEYIDGYAKMTTIGDDGQPSCVTFAPIGGDWSVTVGTVRAAKGPQVLSELSKLLAEWMKTHIESAKKGASPKSVELSGVTESRD